MGFILDNKKEITLSNQTINSLESSMIRTRLSTTEEKLKNIDANIDNIIDGTNKFINNTEANFKKLDEYNKTIKLNNQVQMEEIEKLKSDLSALKNINDKNHKHLQIQLYAATAIWLASFIILYSLYLLGK